MADVNVVVDPQDSMSNSAIIAALLRPGTTSSMTVVFMCAFMVSCVSFCYLVVGSLVCEQV